MRGAWVSKVVIFLISSLFFNLSNAQSYPAPPTDSAHPGSKIYDFDFLKKDVKCFGREVNYFVPQNKSNSNVYPVVVYGHGQALKLEHYIATFEHLARKGVGVIFPMYDKGFFDQEWERMGRDYINLTDCILKQTPEFSKTDIVFSGHSKGAYVASIAAGLSFKEKFNLNPKSVLLFQTAGFDVSSAKFIPAEVALTAVHSDKDTVVSRSLSESLFKEALSTVKQMIIVKSYPAIGTAPVLDADHYWPQTEPTLFGGKTENALHYYSAWKWLVASAFDLSSGAKSDQPYLYGDKASDKGVPGLEDAIIRAE